MHRLREYSAIAADVASTDATLEEALTLVNIAALESGFERAARGALGEVGAFQNIHGHPGAKAALALLRLQGMLGYCGCPRRSPRCDLLVEHRTGPARQWLAAHPAGDALAKEGP